ncbi:MAG: MBL fold metallo-hydrolase [Eubacterium sp.]|nr:MBL fold metallo-hydrolase [Eubacterium sp.]
MTLLQPPYRRIADGVYLINEFDGTNCYLLIGSRKALLIDCGTGFCDLRGTVESLTNLPVTVAATHGHVDHCGGAGQFEALYLHQNDCTPLYRLQRTRPVRRLFTAFNGAVKAHGITAAAVTKPRFHTKIVPFADGFRFELGGKTVTAHLTPGHTKGSVAFVDEADRLIFSGDNVCDALWLHLPGRTSVEEWLPSARWLYAKSADYRIFWGHRTPELTRDYIHTVISWGEAILRRQPRNTLLPRTKQYPPQPDGILYKTNTVHQKRK